MIVQSSPTVYLFGDPHVDRERLVTQSRLFSGYLQAHARQFLGPDLGQILDLGCSEGLSTALWARLYPHAHILGIDRDAEAIEKARAGHRLFRQMEWAVGDIEESLPLSRFDLVYASLVMLHLHNLPGVVHRVFERLAPGGTLWVHDMDISFTTRYPSNPPYQELAALTVRTLDAIGAHIDVARHLAPLLPAAGFTEIRTHPEVYPLGGLTDDGRTAALVMLGVFYNARAAICRTQNLSESAFKRLHNAAVAISTNPALPAGEMPLVNILARRQT